MPKREGAGRKPKGEYHGKRAVFGTRITTELREALEVASERSGRSLSQEVERRLRDSFGTDYGGDREAEQERRYGGRELSAVFRLAGQLVSTIEFSTGGEWHSDRFTFDRVVEGIQMLIAAFAPSGAGREPAGPMAEHWRDNPRAMTAASVAGLLDQLRMAEAAAPLPRRRKGGGRDTHSDLLVTVGAVKARLGPLAERVTVPPGPRLVVATASIKKGK